MDHQEFSEGLTKKGPDTIIGINKSNIQSNASIVTTPAKSPQKIVVKEIEKKPVKLSIDEQGCSQWKSAVETQTSIFTDMLMGQLLSAITCKSCGNSSNTFESFFILELPLPTKPKATLRQCFEEFCKQEDLVDLWTCPHCKAKKKAHKTLRIWRLPPVLAICFKRFEQNGSKNECLVSVSLTGEDLESTLAVGAKKKLPGNNSMQYQPFGFVVIVTNEASYRLSKRWTLHMFRSELSRSNLEPN